MLDLIEQFRIKTLKLIEEYPDYEEQIIESSIIVYTNWKPSLSISRKISDENLIKDITDIYNECFNKSL
jgi:hypothetical protein